MTFNGNNTINWNSVKEIGGFGTFIRCFAQDPGNSDHMLAGGINYPNMKSAPGFYESWDGGESWTLVEGMEGVRDVRIIFFHPTRGEAWLGTHAGIWIYNYEAQ